jgi:hypothetical protein
MSVTRATLAALAICAFASVPQASAAGKTTAPTTFVDAHVTLTDDGIRISRDWAPRGAIVRFSIANTGTRPHSFTFEHFVTGFRLPIAFQALLRPGQHRRVLLFLDYRGVLHYYSKGRGDRAKKRMHGTFRIGAPPKSKVDA